MITLCENEGNALNKLSLVGESEAVAELESSHDRGCILALCTQVTHHFVPK